MGRDRQVVDIPLDHPSCSKQHAVIQYRLVNIDDDVSGKTKTVIRYIMIDMSSSRGQRPQVLTVFFSLSRPYIIDLGSTNGTFLNGVRIEDSRYIELKEKDVLKFGNSTREFVLLHEGSATGGEED